jgi:hypothetical protein
LTFPATRVKEMARYLKYRARYGTCYYTSNLNELEARYPGITEHVANEIGGVVKKTNEVNSNYIELRTGGIRVRLDAADLTVEINEKVKFTEEELTRIKDDLASAFEVISQAAKMDKRLRPQGTVEI